MRSRAIPFFFALVALATTTPRVHAQDEPEPPPPRKSLQIIPKVGGFFGGGDLGSFGEIEDPTRTRTSGKLGFGVGVELAFPREPFNLRLSADYVGGSEIRRDRVPTGGSVDILNVTIGGSMRSFLRTPRTLQSYIMAGVGFKYYSFETGDSQFAEISGTKINPAGQLGFGMNLRTGPVALVLEAVDYVSWFNPNDRAISTAGKMQNDLFLQAGVRFTVF